MVFLPLRWLGSRSVEEVHLPGLWQQIRAWNDEDRIGHFLGKEQNSRDIAGLNCNSCGGQLHERPREFQH